MNARQLTMPTTAAMRSRPVALALSAALLLGGCSGGDTRDVGDGGGAATGDGGVGAGAAGSARSNAAVQQGRPANDTLPGGDSRPRQRAGGRDSGSQAPRR